MKEIYFHDLWSNCYQGSTCVYYRTALTQQCDGACSGEEYIA